MKAWWRTGAALALAGCIAGCATPPSTATRDVVTSRQTGLIAPDRTADAVAIGQSTRADVIAALGETLVIRFDTGYEVWVYRLAMSDQETRSRFLVRPGSQRAGRDTTAEFVVLFAPSGIVKKTRIRPARQRDA
jgi:outer membrane protein assembly factor BamE (lipoprotein component of BamABCDE complex)